MKKIILFIQLILIGGLGYVVAQDNIKDALKQATSKKDAKRILLNSYGCSEKEWKKKIENVEEMIFAKHLFNYAENDREDPNSIHIYDPESFYDFTTGEKVIVRENVKLSETGGEVHEFGSVIGRFSKEWINPDDPSLRYMPPEGKSDWWQIVFQYSPKEYTRNTIMKMRHKATSEKSLEANEFPLCRSVLLHYTYNIEGGRLTLTCEAVLYFDMAYYKDYRAIKNVQWPAICYPNTNFDSSTKPYYDFAIAEMNKFVDKDNIIGREIVELNKIAQDYFFTSKPGYTVNGKYRSWTEIRDLWKLMIENTKPLPTKYPEVVTVVNGIPMKSENKNVVIDTRPDFADGKDNSNNFDAYTKYSVLNTEFTIDPTRFCDGKFDAGRYDIIGNYHHASEFIIDNKLMDEKNYNPYFNDVTMKTFRLVKFNIADPNGSMCDHWLIIDPETGICYQPDGFITVKQYNDTKAAVKKYFSNPFYFDNKYFLALMMATHTTNSILKDHFSELCDEEILDSEYAVRNALNGQYFFDENLNKYRYYGRDEIYFSSTDYLIDLSNNTIVNKDVDKLISQGKIDYYMNNFAGKEVAIICSSGSFDKPEINISAQGIAGTTLVKDDNKGICITVGDKKIPLDNDLHFNLKYLEKSDGTNLILADNLKPLQDAAAEKHRLATTKEKNKLAALEKSKIEQIRRGELLYKNIIDIKKAFNVKVLTQWSGGEIAWLVNTGKGQIYIITSDSGNVIYTSLW